MRSAALPLANNGGGAGGGGGAAAESIGAAVRRGAALLQKAGGGGAAAGVEARALLLDSLGFFDYAELLAREKENMPPAAADKYAGHLRERREGRPVAYILGWREFYSRRFRTTPAALIPRPETEGLVEAALWHLPDGGGGRRVLDLGAGCGAIGVSIALARPRANVWMTDVDEGTLALARQNAADCKAENVRFRRGDWCAAVAEEGAFDVIICNPPYVAAGDSCLRKGDLRFEPPLALVGGEDGLDALKRIIAETPAHLRRGGVLLVEHGAEQAGEARRFFAAAGYCGMRSLRDMAGIDRVMLAVLP